MLEDIKSVLISEKELEDKISELGARISKDYCGKNLLVLSVLKGASVFMSDIIRKITIPIQIDFMAASSYGKGTATSGSVKIIKDLDEPLEGKNVLIVEDIIDSGNTLHYLVEILYKRQPKNIRICTLLDKPERRVADVHVDYTGFVIPDEFVVGYGLDYDQKYRNLPFIGSVVFDE